MVSSRERHVGADPRKVTVVGGHVYADPMVDEDVVTTAIEVAEFAATGDYANGWAEDQTGWQLARQGPGPFAVLKLVDRYKLNDGYDSWTMDAEPTTADVDPDDYNRDPNETWQMEVEWVDLLTGDVGILDCHREPDVPECDGEGDHWWIDEWTQGHGGGVMVRERCGICGATRTTDTWATNRATGAVYPHNVITYEPGEAVFYDTSDFRQHVADRRCTVHEAARILALVRRQLRKDGVVSRRAVLDAAKSVGSEDRCIEVLDADPAPVAKAA